MDPVQRGIALPLSRLEIQAKPKGEIIRLFFQVFQMAAPPEKLTKWLIKEVQLLSMRNKLPQRIAILIMDVMGTKVSSKKDTFNISNQINSVIFNKLLLTSASGYFRTACTFDWEENHEFTFRGCSNALFEQLCTFFQQGTIPKPDLEELLHLYAIAQEYQIDNLVDFCHDTIAGLIGGIQFIRLPQGQIVLEIHYISENFETSFPFVCSNSNRLDIFSFIHSFKICGTALEAYNPVLVNLVKNYTTAQISICLSTTSIHASIPVLLKWDDVVAKRISHLEVETNAIPTNFDSTSGTSNLLLKLFDKCIEVTSCRLSAIHIQADGLTKKILSSMTHLEELSVNAPITEAAFSDFPEESILKVLEIKYPLTMLPAEIIKAKMLQKLCFGALQELTLADIVSLTKLPDLCKLELCNSLNEECLAQLLQQPTRTIETASQFEELTLTTDQLTAASFRMIANSYLKKLHFRKARDLQDQDLEILSTMSFLQSFGVEEGSSITNSGLREFVNAIGLKELVLENCMQISEQFFESPLAIKKVKLIAFSELTHLKFFENVKKLSLIDCKSVNDGAMRTLHSYVMQELTIKRCPISQIDFHSLLLQLPVLKRFQRIDTDQRKMIKNRL